MTLAGIPLGRGRRGNSELTIRPEPRLSASLFHQVPLSCKLYIKWPVVFGVKDSCHEPTLPIFRHAIPSKQDACTTPIGSCIVKKRGDVYALFCLSPFPAFATRHLRATSGPLGFVLGGFLRAENRLMLIIR